MKNRDVKDMGNETVEELVQVKLVNVTKTTGKDGKVTRKQVSNGTLTWNVSGNPKLPSNMEEVRKEMEKKESGVGKLEVLKGKLEAEKDRLRSLGIEVD